MLCGSLSAPPDCCNPGRTTPLPLCTSPQRSEAPLEQRTGDLVSLAARHRHRQCRCAVVWARGGSLRCTVGPTGSGLLRATFRVLKRALAPALGGTRG